MQWNGRVNQTKWPAKPKKQPRAPRSLKGTVTVIIPKNWSSPKQNFISSEVLPGSTNSQAPKYLLKVFRVQYQPSEINYSSPFTDKVIQGHYLIGHKVYLYRASLINKLLVLPVWLLEVTGNVRAFSLLSSYKSSSFRSNHNNISFWIQKESYKLKNYWLYLNDVYSWTEEYQITNLKRIFVLQ